MSAAGVKVFSPHLFNHHVGLERQFNDTEAIHAIEAEANAEPATYTRHFSRLQIVWITLKYPFELIASVFFRAIAFCLSQIALQKGARIFSVLSKQMKRDWQQIGNQWQFNGGSSPLLMPAFNVHQTSSWDVYMHGSIPQSFLIDKDVISMTSYDVNFKHGVKEAMKVFYQQIDKVRRKEGGWFGGSGVGRTKEESARIRNIFAEKYVNSPADAIRFLKHHFAEKGTEKALNKLYDMLKQVDAYLEQNFREIRLYSDGLCRGASLWFIHLYLKTAGKFKDPLQHLLAVSSQFKAGIPKQGALLQSLEKAHRLLKMDRQRLKQHDISLYELDCNREIAERKIASIDEGIYRLGVLSHSLVYIKIQGAGYLWDPVIGLLPKNEKQLLTHILERYYQPGNHQSKLYFEKYDLLANSH